MVNNETLNTIKINTCFHTNTETIELVKLLLVKEKLKNGKILNDDDREVITQSFKVSNCRDFEDVIDTFPWECIDFEKIYLTEKEEYCKILFKKEWDMSFPHMWENARIRLCASLNGGYDRKEIIPDDVFNIIIRNASAGELCIVLQDIAWQEKYVSLITSDNRDVFGDEFEMPFELISNFATLDSHFIKKYESKLNWKLITKYHVLSDEFVRTFWENLDKEILQDRLGISK